MRNEVAAVLLVVAIFAGAGAGYYAGNSNQHTTTSVSTYTLTTGGGIPTTANIRVQAASCIGGASNMLTVTLENAGGGAGTVSGISPANLNDNTTISYAIYPFATNQALHFRPTANTLAAGQTITGSLIVSGETSVPFTATCS